MCICYIVIVTNSIAIVKRHWPNELDHQGSMIFIVLTAFTIIQPNYASNDFMLITYADNDSFVQKDLHMIIFIVIRFCYSIGCVLYCYILIRSSLVGEI
jgi:hypothetical protein